MASIELEDDSTLKDWQGAFRNAVVNAIEEIAESYGVSKPTEHDIAWLFRPRAGPDGKLLESGAVSKLDSLARTLWLRGQPDA